MGLERCAAVLPALRGQRPRRARSFTAPVASCGSRSSARRGSSTADLSKHARRPGSRASPTTTAPSRTALDVPGHQKGGRRWSAADALPASGASSGRTSTCHRGDRARRGARRQAGVGVRYRDKRGGEQVARAGREVILSAGAIGSPQILQLSGIGPRHGWPPPGVEARHELPGVGSNLQDHPYLTMLWEVSEGGTLYGADSPRQPRRVAAAPHRAAHLDRRGDRRLRPHAARACRQPTSSSTWAPSTSRTTAPRSSTATR